jgi:hypothetical protein
MYKGEEMGPMRSSKGLLTTLGVLSGGGHMWQFNADMGLYRRESILAIVVFPSQNNNNLQCVFGVLQLCETLNIF